MEVISFKIDEEMARAIDDAMKPLYSTKTEFIREALRKHIDDIRAEKIIMENLGKYRHMNITDRDIHKTREKVFNETAKRLGVKL